MSPEDIAMLPTKHAAAPDDLAAWAGLSAGARLAIVQQAMHGAAETLALGAETLAEEIENGVILDRGAPVGLRHYAALIRAANPDALPCAGRA